MEETIEEVLSDEMENDPADTLLLTVQKRQNELNRKIVALKASTDSLKEQLKLEKKNWVQEIQETAALEKQIKKSSDEIKATLHIDESERKRKLEMFKEYLFFTNTTMNLESELKKKSYQDWLSEIAEECNQELSKVQDSLTVLKPLREIASKWSLEEKHDDKNGEKGQGDTASEHENTNIYVE